MTVERVKLLVENDERYKGFKFLDKPTQFRNIFLNKDHVVQIHDVTPLGNLLDKNDDISGIVGFVGAFWWRKNEIHPSDGDSYSSDFTIYGYKEFDIPGSDLKGLDVLAEDW